MIFNSPIFLGFFLVVYPTYLLLARPRPQNAFLLLASYFFYGWGNPKYLALLFFYTVATYGVAIEIGRSVGRRRRLALAVGIAINLVVLGYFKYYNFFVVEVGALLTTLGISRADHAALNIFLPIGISFFTFQSIAYLVDVHKAVCPAERDFVTFALFKSFFPQLVAGPIERANHIMPQLHRVRRVGREELLVGSYWILLGFFLKSVIADRMAPFVDYSYRLSDGASGSLLHTAQAGWAFGLQIYCDFAGYSYIAIGCARLMGFELVRNFLAPYWATSIQDFWRRWHVSLSFWLRDYLYHALGGSRSGIGRTLCNLFVTMGLGGLWHGANWTFVVWGLFHGAGLAVHRLAMPYLRVIPADVRVVAGWVTTLVFVMSGWLIFRARSLGELQAMLTLPWRSSGDADPALGGVLVLISIIVFCVQFAEEKVGNGTVPLVKRAAPFWRIVLLVALSAATFGTGFSNQSFIYFQF